MVHGGGGGGGGAVVSAVAAVTATMCGGGGGGGSGGSESLTGTTVRPHLDTISGKRSGDVTGHAFDLTRLRGEPLPLRTGCPRRPVVTLNKRPVDDHPCRVPKPGG